MFVTNWRKKVFTYAVVKFDVDGMIGTIKTNCIYDEHYQKNDNVKVSWGDKRSKEDYNAKILLMTNDWRECKKFEEDYERSNVVEMSNVQIAIPKEKERKAETRKSAKRPKTSTSVSTPAPKKAALVSTPAPKKAASNPATISDRFKPAPLDMSELSFIQKSTNQDVTSDVTLILENYVNNMSDHNDEDEQFDAEEEIENQALYIEGLEESLTKKLDELENTTTTKSTTPVTRTTIDEIWSYIYKVEARIDERITRLEENLERARIDFCISPSKVFTHKSLPGGSPSVGTKRFAPRRIVENIIIDKTIH